MRIDSLEHFQSMLVNERTFDRLFCDVFSSSKFDLFYNEHFRDDPVFNHAAIKDSILSGPGNLDAESIAILFNEIRTESGKRNVRPTVFLESLWRNTNSFAKGAVEEGYLIGGQMEILSKNVARNSSSKSAEIRVEGTDDEVLWNDVFMKSFSIGPNWREELLKRERMLVRHHPTKLLVAKDKEGNTLGCILLHRFPQDYLGIYCVGTLPEFRNRGVAQHMMLKAEEIASSLECQFLTLQTIVADGVTPLYLKLGFKIEFHRDVLLLP